MEMCIQLPLNKAIQYYNIFIFMIILKRRVYYTFSIVSGKLHCFDVVERIIKIF